ARGIDKDYVPLACQKTEFDPETRQKTGTATYDERTGWIDGYIDQWLEDPSKEHISVLGEFGTGKTWFAQHLAWVLVDRYRAAKKRGLQRPRLPVYVPLREYARLEVPAMFSDLFFRKHAVEMPNYAVFEEMNRMGRTLLIFDGFDEMADRIDQNKVVENF